MKEKNLIYAVNCDCDCMLDLNYSFKDVINWFESDEAKESYAEDFDEVTLKTFAIEHLSNLLREYKNGKLLSDVLDLSWNEI